MKSQKGVTLIVLLIIIIVIMLFVAFLINKYLHMKTDKMEAEYEARFHTITFDTDGGKTISPKKVQSFAGISNVNAEKSGYIFEGWLLDGQLIDVNNSTPLTQDVILKAKYRKKVDNDNNDNNTNNFSSSYNNQPSSNPSNNINNSNNNKPSNNNSNIQAQPEDKKTYNVNIRKTQTNNWGDTMCALTVTNYQTESYNSEVGKVQEGQEWVIVNMKFENMSDSTIIIDKSDFEIVDGAGKYGYAPWYKHLNTELGTKEIRAGQTATFSARFVYYKNNEMILRFYHPSIVTEVYTDIKLR